MRMRILTHVVLLSGLGGYCACDPNEALDKLCTADKSSCVSLSQMKAELDQRFAAADPVGYAYVIGGLPQAGSGGYARTSADPPQTAFDEWTRLNVQSVSKTVTAVAALKALEEAGVDLDDAIGPWMPGGWTLGECVADITFRELLTHRSGVTPEYGGAIPPADMEAIAGMDIACAGPCDCDYPYNYENWNYQLFNELIPNLTGTGYKAYVKANVLEPAGISDASCTPADPITLAYRPSGNGNGYDFGDLADRCGAAGWQLSARDLWVFLLDRRDGDMLTDALRNEMDTGYLGWNNPLDIPQAAATLEHSGYGFDPADPSVVIQTMIIEFPTGLLATAVANSDTDVWGIMLDAYDAAKVP